MPYQTRQAMQLVATLTLLAVFPLGCTSWRAAKLYQSGTAELDAGRVARALEDLSEAARLKPDASEIQNHLGLARLAAGDRAAAREAFERAVAIDCDNPAARRNLAAVEVDQREGL